MFSSDQWLKFPSAVNKRNMENKKGHSMQKKIVNSSSKIVMGNEVCIHLESKDNQNPTKNQVMSY